MPTFVWGTSTFAAGERSATMSTTSRGGSRRVASWWACTGASPKNSAGRPLGLDADGFLNEDKFLLHLTNLVRERITPLALRSLDMRPVWLSGKRILKVTVRPTHEPVFVRAKNASESFYVRTGPSTTALSHSDTVAYVRQHFKN